MNNLLFKHFSIGIVLPLILLFVSYANSYGQSCNSGCTTIVNSLNAGSATAITAPLNAVVCIQASTSRSITISGNNVTICVASGATLSSNISFSGSPTNLTINNYGTFSSSLNSGLPTGTVINNAGTWSGNINTTFSGGSITNNGTWSGSISTFTTGTINNTGNWNQAINSFDSGIFNNNNGGSYNTNLTLSGTAVFNHNTGASFTNNSINININDNSTFNNYTTLNKPITINNSGTFWNRSTGSFNNTVAFNGGTFTNNGSATITNSNFDINGIFTSSTGSTLNFTGSVDINSSGSLAVSSNVNFQIGGNLTNNKTFSTQSNLTIGGTFTTNNNGTSSFQSALVTVNGLTTNNGTLNATNSSLTLKAGLTNNGSDIINLNGSLLTVTGTFTNNGIVNNTGSGCVGIRVTGTSTQNGNGVYGTAGPAATTPKTDICTNGVSGFNTNTGISNNTTSCTCSINPLPVTFIGFTGALQNHTVVLKWQTADEKNNKEFVIERSADGKTFEQLATVAGKGTTNQVSAYQFVDTNPFAGNNYYRIRQVDFDNTESYYSKIVVVKTTVVISQVVIAPNPTAGQDVSINLSETPARLKVTVLDMKGTTRISEQYAQPQTENELSVQALEKGIYVIVIQSDKQTETLRLIKL